MNRRKIKKGLIEIAEEIIFQRIHGRPSTALDRARIAATMGPELTAHRARLIKLGQDFGLEPKDKVNETDQTSTP